MKQPKRIVRRKRIVAPVAEFVTEPKAGEPPVEPCPFCGKRHWSIHGDPGFASWVECVSCGATGPAAQGPSEKTPRVAAIEAWNRRATDGVSVHNGNTLAAQDADGLGKAER